MGVDLFIKNHQGETIMTRKYLSYYGVHENRKLWIHAYCQYVNANIKVDERQMVEKLSQTLFGAQKKFGKWIENNIVSAFRFIQGVPLLSNMTLTNDSVPANYCVVDYKLFNQVQHKIKTQGFDGLRRYVFHSDTCDIWSKKDALEILKTLDLIRPYLKDIDCDHFNREDEYFIEKILKKCVSTGHNIIWD